MNRYTFVIQIHPDGESTLENLSTRERIRVTDLDTVGAQIELWLAALPGTVREPAAADDAAPA